MPVRWVLSPVVSAVAFDPESGTTDIFISPKAGIIDDPATGRDYHHSSAIVPTTNYAISFVRGTDFTPLDSDPECIDLFQNDYDDAITNFLDLTPRQLGWKNARLNQLKTVMLSKGVDTTGLTLDTPIRTYLERLCAAIHPSFNPGSLWVRGF